MRSSSQLVMEGIAPFITPDHRYTLPEIELKFNRKGAPSIERRKITSAQDCAEVMREVFNADTIDWVEAFMMICLNRNNQVIGFYKCSQGGISGTVADPRVIFSAAILAGASGIIVAHNHPSGNLKASQADIDLTRKLHAAGKLLEIQLLDHIILSGESKAFFSFANEGLL